MVKQNPFLDMPKWELKKMKKARSVFPLWLQSKKEQKEFEQIVSALKIK